MEFGLKSGYPERREYGWEVGSRRWAGDDYGWQTEESFQKVAKERDRGFLSDTIDTVKQYVADPIQRGIASIPGAEPVLNFIGGVATWMDKNAVDPYRQAAQDPAQVGTPQALLGTILTLPETGSTAGREAARAVGVDVRVGESIGGAAGEALQGGVVGKFGQAAKAISKLPPGTGKLQPAMAAVDGLQLNFGKATATLEPPTVMKAVTTTVPEALEAARVSTGQKLMDARLGEQYTKRTKDILAKENDIKYLKETLEGLDELKGDPKSLMTFIQKDPDLLYTWNRYTEKYGAEEAFDRTRANLAQRKTNADTAWSQIKSNVLPFEKEGDYKKWYGSDAAKPMRRKAEVVLRAKGDLKIKEYLQQHHLIPKGMTAAYFDKMDQLIAAGKAKPDDLIVMALIARNKGMPTGDVKVNLKDLIPTPHAELHTILRRQGDEVAKTKLIKDLSKVDSVDDLMRMWVEEFSPDGRFTYNYETAKIFQELDSLLEEMTGISKNVRKRDVKEKVSKRP